MLIASLRFEGERFMCRFYSQSYAHRGLRSSSPRNFSCIIVHLLRSSVTYTHTVAA